MSAFESAGFSPQVLKHVKQIEWFRRESFPSRESLHVDSGMRIPPFRGFPPGRGGAMPPPMFNGQAPPQQQPPTFFRGRGAPPVMPTMRGGAAPPATATPPAAAPAPARGGFAPPPFRGRGFPPPRGGYPPFRGGYPGAYPPGFPPACKLRRRRGVMGGSRVTGREAVLLPLANT
ncbi:hypothetical protein OSTOST_10491 [Ostertagia ostertagi]